MIQDELSDEAKEAILAYVRDALLGLAEEYFPLCPREVADELKESGYGICFRGGHRFKLSKACIDEISSILSMDFFN